MVAVVNDAGAWLAVRNAQAVERCLERERGLRAELVRTTQQSAGRGLEIERLDRQLAEMTKLALGAETELATVRASAVDLLSQNRELGELLDRSERQRVELEAVLDGVVEDVATAREAERKALERADRLERALSRAQERAANAATEVRALEAAITDFLEAWDLSSSSACDAVHDRVKQLRLLGGARR